MPTDFHYLIGNSKELNNIYAQNSFEQPQLIITSPPYFDLLNYNDHKKQIGYGQESYDLYLNDVCQVLNHCYDLSKNDATLWVVVDTFKKKGVVNLLPFDIVNKLKEREANSWILKDIIIWDKGKNLPWNTNGNFKNEHEYILFFAKSDKFKFKIDTIREIADLKKWWIKYPERYNPNGKPPSNIWSFNTPIRGWGNGKQNHLCPFPFPLVERILSLCTEEGDWVLDPFAGSGSVLAMSSLMNRPSVGIDINRSYKQKFIKEVNDGALTYWSKRIKELSEIETLNKKFRETNKRLRKLKVASAICDHLSSINKNPFIYYVKDSSPVKNEIEINVLQNGHIPNIHIENAELNSLINQSKIKPSIKIKLDDQFILSIAKTKSYKYKSSKFYNYSSSCKMDKVTTNGDKYDYWYSDIPLKISNEKL
ncbi:MAG: site-specific DNA-methyltransferase [Bacteroidetes bacterium]|nr:site-specific DNA-methyltransferase [Bacteroidota bacterium]